MYLIRSKLMLQTKKKKKISNDVKRNGIKKRATTEHYKKFEFSCWINKMHVSLPNIFSEGYRRYLALCLSLLVSQLVHFGFSKL